jgi:hypothetical protein
MGDDSAAARAFWSAQTAIVETLAAFLGPPAAAAFVSRASWSGRPAPE